MYVSAWLALPSWSAIVTMIDSVWSVPSDTRIESDESKNQRVRSVTVLPPHCRTLMSNIAYPRPLTSTIVG